jgi:3-carboxy-cis,cis-muconate cycloisomerase
MSDAGGLFDAVLARGPVRALTADGAWLQAMLDAEAALAWALADTGRTGADEARAIAEQCRAERFDIGAIGVAAADGGNPVIPLVAALRAAVGSPAAPVVHTGATSQDILDTATMLVTARALDAIGADLRAAADRAAALAAAHRATPMIGRTLLQQAVPTTFGLVAGTWVLGLDEARIRLAAVRAERLAAQLGGPAGSLTDYGPGGVAVMERFAARLGLAGPVGPWHTERSRISDIAGALGTAAGAAGTAALDIVLLAQNEVGEVAEEAPDSGGSSSMAHKHNPIAAVSARAAAMQAPGLVANLMAAAGGHELQRAAGAWHAEWDSLRALLRATGSAASWLGESLARLRVDEARMAANLGSEDDVGAAPVLVDRILARRRQRR